MIGNYGKTAPVSSAVVIAGMGVSTVPEPSTVVLLGMGLLPPCSATAGDGEGRYNRVLGPWIEIDGVTAASTLFWFDSRSG